MPTGPSDGSGLESLARRIETDVADLQARWAKVVAATEAGSRAIEARLAALEERTVH